MNADGKGLFAAICADPEDDVSRLVYADWLDEQGDAPRAEALRMSVERRRLPDWEPRAWVLDSRLNRLQERHGKEWETALPKLVEGGWYSGRSGLVKRRPVRDNKTGKEPVGEREQSNAAGDSSGLSEGGSSAAYGSRGDHGQSAPYSGSPVHRWLFGRMRAQGADLGDHSSR